MAGTGKDAAAVAAYLEGLPEVARARVEEVRALVHATVPGLGERISYQILTFARGRTAVVHVGGYAAHTGLYPVPEELRQRCEPWLSGRATLRIPHREELPAEVLAEVVRALAAR